jgi:amidase/aspartyl-tRNA(Asn)/glutamyl-tRNA(Gln) amidotransferase subunit A
MTDDLTWLPAWRLAELIKKREISCREVTEHFLGRIEEFDPVLHAFEEVDHAGAREAARRADREVSDGGDLGSLHGIPTAVKSHIRVHGLRHTQGVESAVSPFDDIGVERLRAAGAIIVGTNTMMGAGADLRHEAGQPGVFSPFNWNAEARNPWDVSRAPGWSSSGGAAGAAARLLPVTIGSDGGGSTRLPAAYSGVVGLHTSRGLIPHIDYLRPTMLLTASYGPLAREVRDVALFTQAMSGGDGRDYVSMQGGPCDCVAGLDRGIEGLRLTWTEDFGFASTYAADNSPAILDVGRAAAFRLAEQGAVVEPTDEVWEDRAEHGTARWTVEPSVYEVMVGTNTRETQKPDPALYREQAESRARNWQKCQRLFERYDLLMSVTSQRIAVGVEEWDRAWTVDGASFPGGSFAPAYTSHTMLFNWLGFPAVSVPCGFVDGMPVGLQIAGWHGRENLVLRVAQAFQTAYPRTERPPVS